MAFEIMFMPIASPVLATNRMNRSQPNNQDEKASKLAKNAFELAQKASKLAENTFELAQKSL